MMYISDSNDLSRLRARFIQVFAIVSILVAITALLPVAIISLEYSTFDFNLILLIGIIVLNGLWLFLLNNGRQQIAETGIVITFTAAAVVTTTPYLLLATLAMLAAAALSSNRTFLIVNLVVLGKLGVDAVLAIQQSNSVLSADLLNYPIMLISLTVMSIVTRFFIQAAQQGVLNTRRNANLLQTSADIHKITARLLDLNQILDQGANLLRNRFGYDHVQVYLMNEREGAVLAAAASPTGRIMLNNGYRVPLGSRTAVGQVMLSGTALLRNLNPTDSLLGGVLHGSEVFGGTLSQLVLPMRDAERIIGLIDLQSSQSQVFIPTDIQALQVMTDLLATSVRNARLYEEQTHIAEQNKNLFEQAGVNLREIERLNQQLTHASWQEYMQSARGIPGVTLANELFVEDSGWSPELTQAHQEGRSISSHGSGTQSVVSVPITLRGEVIGAIEVETGAQSNGADALEMVEAVAQRLALSLENVRLYEETQKSAVQEQRINEISARYQEVTTVDELLRVTLQELGKTLQAERGVIRLGTQEIAS